MASRQVGQLPTNNKDEEEEDEDDEDDSDNKEGEDDENNDNGEEAVKKDVETGIKSDTEDANNDNDDASVWDTLQEDICKVSPARVITYYCVNAIHRCTRTT